MWDRWGDDRLVGRVLLGLFLVELISFNYFAIDANRFLADSDIIFTDDVAATSLRAFDAQSLSQVYGTPSWTSFNHPGAFLMYWHGAFELLDRLLGINIGHVGATYVAHIVFLNVTLLGVFLAARKVLGVDLARTVIFVSIYLSFLLATPWYLTALIEPACAALLFAWFTLACAAAARSNWSYFVMAIALASLCFQLYAGYAHTLVIFFLVLVIYCIKPFYELPGIRRLQVFGASVFVAAVGAVPILYDLAFAGGYNISKVISHTRAVATYPRVSLTQATELVAGNAKVPTALFVSLIVTILFATAVVSLLPRVRDGGDSMTGEGLPQVTMFAVLGFVGAILFYTVSASASYAPPHSSAYAYASLALLVSSAGVALCELYSGGRTPTMAVAVAVLLLPLVTIGTMINSAGVAVFKVPLDPAVVVKAPEMGRLVMSLDEELRQRPDAFVGINVAFPQPTEKAPSEQIELPWRMSVGLMNLLRRKHIRYCVPSAPRPDLVFPWGIVALFGKTSTCSDNSAVVNVAFRCEGGSVLAEFDSERFILAACKS